MATHHPENIDMLLVKTLAGEASSTEFSLLEDWLSQSPENEKYYNQFRQIWDKSASLLPEQGLNEETAWEEFRKRTARHTGTRTRNLRPLLRVAATVLLLIGAGIVFYLSGPAKETTDRVVSSRHETLHETLSDGSEVYLNKHSRMTFQTDFSNETTRKVTLEGEAFFKVARDTAKPFIITVGNVEVKVLGTSFNVKAGKEGTEVIVKTGKVEVTGGGKRAILLPGQAVTVPGNSGEWQKIRQEDELYQYYVDKKLVSNNLPLLRVINVLAAYYETEIKVDPGRVAEKINTTFDLNKPLRYNLDVINQTMGTHDEEKNGIIVIR